MATRIPVYVKRGGEGEESEILWLDTGEYARVRVYPDASMGLDFLSRVPQGYDPSTVSSAYEQGMMRVSRSREVPGSSYSGTMFEVSDLLSDLASGGFVRDALK